MQTMYDWLISCINYFFPTQVLNMTIFTDFIEPLALIWFGYWVLYFLIIKPICFFGHMIGGWVK